MSEGPVRVGIIGCGTQGRIHARIIEELGEAHAHVAALCDLDPERLQDALGDCSQARGFGDYRAMLEAGGLDLVIVVTMPNTHAQMCTAALEAGAHVLCEKPFMTSQEEAVQVLDTAERVGRQVQLATNMRYMPSSQYLHRLVDSGSLGAPVLGKAWGIHDVPPWWGPHYHLASSGGGVLASTLVHTLDLSIWIGGSPNPVSVSASMTRLFPGKRGPLASEQVRARYDAEDIFAALVRFDNGASYILEGNWCDERPGEHHYELVTTKGTVGGQPFFVRADVDGKIVDQTPPLADDGWGESVHTQDQELIGRLNRGEAWDLQDRRQLLNLQKLIDGCYESARTGREIVF